MGRKSTVAPPDQGATLSNEQRINLLLQQTADTDTVLFVLSKHQKNLAAIEDEEQRCSLAAKFQVPVPTYDPVFKQRLQEQVRKCKSKFMKDVAGGELHEMMREDNGEAKELVDLPMIDIPRFSLGIDSLDELLGKDKKTGEFGMPYGACAVLGAPRACGKTRLMVEVAAAVGDPDLNEDEFGNLGVLYIQNEEKLEIFRSRYARKWTDDHNILLSSSDNLLQHASLVDMHRPRLVIIDSIQDTRQARYSAGIIGMLMTYKAIATSNRCSFILISHVTVKGTLKGGSYPGHKVDMELMAKRASKGSPTFSISCEKNRYGISGLGADFVHTDRGVESASEVYALDD
jgi:predicted ATP-dependent serine protease